MPTRDGTSRYNVAVGQVTDRKEAPEANVNEGERDVSHSTNLDKEGMRGGAKADTVRVSAPVSYSYSEPFTDSSAEFLPEPASSDLPTRVASLMRLLHEGVEMNLPAKVSAPQRQQMQGLLPQHVEQATKSQNTEDLQVRARDGARQNIFSDFLPPTRTIQLPSDPVKTAADRVLQYREGSEICSTLILHRHPLIIL